MTGSLLVLGAGMWGPVLCFSRVRLMDCPCGDGRPLLPPATRAREAPFLVIRGWIWPLPQLLLTGVLGKSESKPLELFLFRR